MENIISKGQKYFYENKACKLIQGNSLEVLKNIKPESIDMIFADPPYFLSNLTKPSEKVYGKHPTQKAEYLLERIIQASTLPGHIVLDPFCGSGTTGVVANRQGRDFIGIDLNEDYLQITKKRLGN